MSDYQRTASQERNAQWLAAIAGVFIAACVVVLIVAARTNT